MADEHELAMTRLSISGALVARLTDRVDSLEIKLAFQEQTLEELNTALSRQTLENIDLKRQVLMLKDAWQRYAAQSGVGAGSSSEHEPPPHY